MADARNRVSITLTDSEMEQVKALSQILGIKPTRVVYEALKAGMPLIFNKEKQFSAELSAESVGLIDVANKGAAINRLSGAALANASLAALGGGAVAAGAGAVAGSTIGTAVVNVIEMKDKFYNLIDAMFSELPESSKEK
jgi:hypothetical protein